MDLITRNLQEIFGQDELESLINSGKQLVMYWGTAPTGRIHIGYFLQLLKIADYVKSGCKVKILIADLHAYLDNMKTSMELLEYRSQYYILVIMEIMKVLNIDLTKIEFIKGTSFQLSPKYTLDMYKLNSMITLSKAKHAGAEVVKQSDNPTMTGLLYPTLQVLDEQYLDVDCFCGGIDQRKICAFSRDMMPSLGYKKRIHLLTPIISGLRFEKKDSNNEIETKMSSSNQNSKIDLLDTKNIIKKKINKAYCLVGDVDDNCLIELLENLLFPILWHKDEIFVINRDEKYGGKLEYANIIAVKYDFQNEKLHPADLKFGIIDNINKILEPIRNSFDSNEMKTLLKKAYP